MSSLIKFRVQKNRLVWNLFAVIIFLSSKGIAYIGGDFPGKDFNGAISWNWGPFSCSGTKLSEHYILTAAHCLGYENEFAVYVRSFDLVEGGPLGTYQDSKKRSSKVIKVHFHPGWLAKNYEAKNDLALIELSDIGAFSAVKIATETLTRQSKVLVGGFGCKGGDFPRYPHLTVAIKQPIKIETGAFYFGILDSDGVKRSISCPGDSGGGVYRYKSRDSNYEVVGVNHAMTISLDDLNKQVVVDIKSGKITAVIGDPQLISTDLTEKDNLVWLKSVLPSSLFSIPE